MAAGVTVEDFGYVIEPTWHRLPQYVLIDKIGVSEVEEVFDYDIVKVPVFARFEDEDGTFEYVEVEQYMSVANSKTRRTIGMHSPKYGENQPKDIFPQIAEVLIDHGFEVVSVGTCHATAKMFLSAKLPDDFSFDFGGTQVIEKMVNLGDAVDGSTTFRMAQAARRIQCANTFQLNLVGIDPLKRIKHTAAGQIEVVEFARELDDTLKEQKQVNEAIERLIEASYTEADFTKMIRHESMLGERPTEDGRGKTVWDRRFDELVASFNHPNLDGIRESQFGAIMAVQYVGQHVASVHGGEAKRAARHLDNLVFKSQKLAESAAQLVMAN